MFKAYDTINDNDFLEFIRGKKNTYEEGDNLGLTPCQLMSLAHTKHHALVGQKKWQVLSARNQQLLVLEASMNKLKEGKHKASQTDQKKPTTKGKMDKSLDNDKASLTIGLKNRQPETKDINDKTRYWCKWHGKWSTNDHICPTAMGFVTIDYPLSKWREKKSLSTCLANDIKELIRLGPGIRAGLVLIQDEAMMCGEGIMVSFGRKQ